MFIHNLHHNVGSDNVYHSKAKRSRQRCEYTNTCSDVCDLSFTQRTITIMRTRSAPITPSPHSTICVHMGNAFDSKAPSASALPAEGHIPELVQASRQHAQGCGLVRKPARAAISCNPIDNQQETLSLHQDAYAVTSSSRTQVWTLSIASSCIPSASELSGGCAVPPKSPPCSTLRAQSAWQPHASSCAPRPPNQTPTCHVREDSA